MRSQYGPGNVSSVVQISLSNVLFCALLIIIRKFEKDSDATILLALGNGFSAIFAMTKRIVIKGKESDASCNNWLVLSWSVAYSSCYLIFIYFKGSITFAHMVIAESIVPILSVIITAYRRPDRQIVLSDKIITVLALCLLLLIAYFEWPEDLADCNSIAARWFTFLGIFLCFLVSQVSARTISLQYSISEAMPRVAFSNSFLLFFYVCVNRSGIGNGFDTTLWGKGLIIGGLMMLTQFFLLNGMRLGSPIITALTISTSIPITVLCDNILNKNKVVNINCMISILYCLCIFMLALKNNLKTDHIK